MQTSIDKFGRIVIPKRFREDLGLAAGQAVELEREADRIVVRAANTEPVLAMEADLLVYTGRVDGDIWEAIQADREKRMNDVVRRGPQ